MKAILLALAIVCLLANVAPSILFLMGRIDLPTAKSAMIVTTLAWYVVAAFLIYGRWPAVADNSPGHGTADRGGNV